MLATKPRRTVLSLAVRGRRSTATLPAERTRRRPDPGCPELASGFSPSPRASAARSRRPECRTDAGVSRRRGCDLAAGPCVDPESGLIYLRARYYDPTTGQFLTRDPWMALSRQPYAYASGDPVSLVDPTGRCDFLCVVGVVAGGVSLFTGVGEVAAGAGLLGETASGLVGVLSTTATASGAVATGTDLASCVNGGGTLSCVGAASGGVGVLAGFGAGAGLFGDTLDAEGKVVETGFGTVGLSSDLAGAFCSP